MTRPTSLTKKWQVEQMERPVLPSFIRQEKEVHGKFTSVDYVRLMLNYVFPASWDFELISEPSRLDLNVNTALYVCAARLTVTWADGTKSVHEASGATKLEAGWKKDEKKRRPVNEANINQHIMGYLGCRSSALKSCAADLGPVFRPLSDDKVSEFVWDRDKKRKVNDLKENHGIDVSQESAAQSMAHLFGDDGETPSEPTSVPQDHNEFWKMALALPYIEHKKHLDNILQNYLNEQHGGGDIAAFIKTGPENIAVLWAVLMEHGKAQAAELEEDPLPF